MLHVEDLSKTFGGSEAPALRSVNLDTEDGHVVGYVGLDGAGRTATIGVVAGVLWPRGGKAIMNGFDASRDHEGQRSTSLGSRRAPFSTCRRYCFLLARVDV